MFYLSLKSARSAAEPCEKSLNERSIYCVMFDYSVLHTFSQNESSVTNNNLKM